jgi:dTDP-glucose 4,6-dehydratase
MKLVVTGGAGFIGSNFVHYMLEQHPDLEIIVVDKLTYAGNLKNLSSALQNPRLRFVRMDVCGPELVDVVQGSEAVVHFAAESHVDRSIEDAAPFVRTNVEGTWRMVETCRRARVGRFLHISTDEVYGSLGPDGKFVETSPLAPTSPYAASKAAADLVVLSYIRTHGFPAIITRCTNNYGPYQFPEKFIPLMIAQAMANQPLPIYGDGQNVRDWIHVSDHCRALDVILQEGKEGEIYNIGGECELRNIDVARRILKALDRSESLICFVADRLGHDRRYALDCTKLKSELGWEPGRDFDGGLAETIRWYQKNSAWFEETRSGQYRDYFERHYVHRETTFAAFNSRSN